MAKSQPFSSDVTEGDLLSDYRPISRLSLLALLVGLASAIAFADPLLLIVPLAGAALAGFALFQISRSRVAMLGRGAALAGLVFSLMFGAWVGARDWTRQQTLYREADAIGQNWLELIREGKLLEAHQLHLPQSKRADTGTSLKKFYDEQAHGQGGSVSVRDLFIGRELEQVDPQASIRRLSNEGIRRDGKADEITQRYAVDYDRDGRHKSLVVEIVLKRTAYPYVGESQWEVARVNTTLAQ